MTTVVLTVVCKAGRVSSVPKTEAKKHISLTLTREELELLDSFAESMGPGTYRNEAVVEAIRRVSGKTIRSSAPVERPGYLRPRVEHVPGGREQPRHPGVIPGQRVTERFEDE